MRCTRPPVGEAAQQAAFAQATVPVLRTERLVLRAPRLEDLPHWTSVWQASDPTLTEEHLWEEFCVYTAGWLLHGHGAWTIERGEDGTPLGFVLLGLEWDDDEPEIGWALLPEHRGRGYATEAARAARQHAAALLGPGQSVSYIAPDNAASAAVARRLGAVRDSAAEARLSDDAQVWRHGAGGGSC